MKTRGQEKWKWGPVKRAPVTWPKKAQAKSVITSARAQLSFDILER